MLKGKWGLEGSTAKGAVGPEVRNDVVLRRYIAEGCGDDESEISRVAFIGILRKEAGTGRE